mgnify:CR=1 FL=1
MPTERKVRMVEELRDLIARSSVAVSTEYRGLTVAQMTQLRRVLRNAGGELHVVKNTLASIAADQAGRGEFKELLKGPTAVVFGFDDPVAPVKALIEHLRAERLEVPITAGWLEGRVLTPEEVRSLATLPSREELIGQVAAKLQSPLYNLAMLLQATVREFAGLIDARARQLEEAA